MSNERGQFTDARDGKVYAWAEIGTQTWMAENLNYETVSGSYIYKDVASNAQKYGRLYEWETALEVCPDGWELPSVEDWNKLASTINDDDEAGHKLKSIHSWADSGNGTDEYGFTDHRRRCASQGIGHCQLARPA